MDTNVYFNRLESLYQEVTGSGKAPWLQEGPGRGIAYNPRTGMLFTGLNGIMLDMSAAAQGFKDPRWISFRDALQAGLTLRHGEQPAPAAYTHAAASRTNCGLLCNLEQFREYSRIPPRDMNQEKELAKEKLQAALDHAGAATFSSVLYKLDETARDNLLTHTLARYRLAQECGEPYTPLVTQKGIQKEGAAGIPLIRSLYYAERIKNQLLSPSRGRDREREQDRTRDRRAPLEL
jgi:hypothetical protein